MKATGIVRKVDELGRIVLPVEMRRTLDIAEKADESGNEKSRPDMGRDFLHCLDKGNPRLCRGRKRAYSEGRSRQEKVSKLE